MLWFPSLKRKWMCFRYIIIMHIKFGVGVLEIVCLKIIDVPVGVRWVDSVVFAYSISQFRLRIALITNPVSNGSQHQGLFLAHIVCLCVLVLTLLSVIFTPDPTRVELLLSGTPYWDKMTWQSLPRFLKLPLRNDTYHFCSSVICQSKSQANADNSRVGTDHLSEKKASWKDWTFFLFLM